MNLEAVPFHPLADLFPLIDGQEFEALRDDIAAHGVREPVVLYEGAILDGRNRYRAARDAGVDCPMHEYRGNDPVAYVVSLNIHRRHLTEAQRASVAARLANMRRGRPTQDKGANLPFIGNEPVRVSNTRAAELLNVSERSVKSARRVHEKGAPDLVKALDEGRISVSAASDISEMPAEEQAQIVAKGEKEILAAAKAIRAEKAAQSRVQRLEKIEEISRGNTELDTRTRYPIIYADPPWRYENPPMGGTNRSIENHYPTMTLEEICAMPVSELAAPDAMLYLWATAPKLVECLEVVKAWGFEYRTNIVWDKEKIGMGYHARNQHEILLICKRGNIPPPEAGRQPASVHREARAAHSAKPQFYYEMIEAAYPGLPKIELFCRSPREGWAAWGNQAEAAA